MKIKVDFHVHTNQSIDGVSSLEEILIEAKKRNIDAIAITDHNLCCKETREQLQDIIVIPGCEVSTTDGHIVGIFLKSIIEVNKLWNGRLPSAEEAIKEIHDKGGFAILAHPFASKKAVSKNHLAKLVDGVEVINARACFKNPYANLEAEQFAIKHDRIQIGGSDAHSKKEVGNAYTVVECGERSLKNIEEAVRAAQTAACLKTCTPHYRKGNSQFIKATRSQNKAYVLKACVYLGYCIGLDLYEALHKFCTQRLRYLK